jgi:SAM-dependent methyltransferase
MYIFQPDRYLLQEQIKKVAHYMGGAMLDIGAGEFNRYERHFKRTSYVKMDVHAGPNVDVVGSIEKMPFEAESFDSVVCTQVFEHIPHPQKGAEEVFRVLKKGGYFLMTVPQMNELHEEPHDYFRYTNFGLKTLFEDVGFTLVSVEARGGYFTTMSQMVCRYMLDRFRLHKRPFLGRIASPCFKIMTSCAFFLDRVDKSAANKKHTIGWCVICKKP